MDRFNLQRFIGAQDDRSPGYGTVVKELKNGHKLTHWMWYIFPQIVGLGRTEMSRLYALSGRDEAKAYLRHPILGLRLRECTQLMLDVDGRSSEQILGDVDSLKLCSCMTLFEQTAAEPTIFNLVLAKYFDGARDQLTLQILAANDRRSQS